MAPEAGEVGTLDISAPPMESFADLRVWTDIEPYVRELLAGDGVPLANQWHDRGHEVNAAQEELSQLYTGIEKIEERLDHAVKGPTGNALHGHLRGLRRSVKIMIDTLKNPGYGKVIDDVGHDIRVFAREFDARMKLGHRLREIEENKIEGEIRKAYDGTTASGDEVNAAIARGRTAAYQNVEQNITIPSLRAVLTALAVKYQDRGKALRPFTTTSSSVMGRRAVPEPGSAELKTDDETDDGQRAGNCEEDDVALVNENTSNQDTGGAGSGTGADAGRYAESRDVRHPAAGAGGRPDDGRLVGARPGRAGP